ncbi:MAG: chloride channel protein [Gammaproteobacteria bacterium]
MLNPLRHSLRRSRYEFLSRRAWRHRLVFWLGAVAVGIISYLFVRGGSIIDHHVHALVARWPWLPFLVTPLGLALTAWITRRWFSGAEGSGIPQAIAAIRRADRGVRLRLLSLRIAVGKFLLTWAALLAGGSVGVFAPTVHIGASLLYGVGARVGIRHQDMQRGLILAGGAAGIAAAFNTPLAGIVFAIEEMSRSLHERSSGLMLSAVIIAGLTALVLLGQQSPFPPIEATLPSLGAWLSVPAIGLSGGVLGALFSILLILSTRLATPLLARRGIALAIACGAVVALCSWLTGGLIHGTGFLQAAALASGDLESGLLYPLAKMVATLASYLSGVPAGIFGPALGIGAGIGSALAGWFSDVAPGILVLFGMVAFFSGMAQTPITAVVVILELCDNHQLLLPLMATAFLAYAASRIICHKPIYRALAEPFLRPPPTH